MTRSARPSLLSSRCLDQPPDQTHRDHLVRSALRNGTLVTRLPEFCSLWLRFSWVRFEPASGAPREATEA
jgi:hypothetical protein